MIVGLIVGALFATATASGIPQYARSLEIVSMHAAVEDVGKINTNVHVNSSWVPLSAEERALADAAVFSAAEHHLGEMMIDTNRLTKSREHWWGWEDRGLRQDDLASLGSFQYIENFNDHVTYVKGRAPTNSVQLFNGEPAVEVAVIDHRATLLQISVGDVLVAQPIERGTGLIHVVVTGTYDVTDPTDVFWLQLSEVYLAPSIEGREQPLIMAVMEQPMFNVVAEANAGLPANYDWFLYVDQEIMADKSIADLERTYEEMTVQLEDSVVRPFVITEMIPRIRTMKQRALFGSIPLMLMALLLFGCVAFYLTMATGLLGRKRVAGYMMLRSRGFNIRQQFAVHMFEAALITVPVVLVAPLFSALVIKAIGFLPAYRSISDGAVMPVELSLESWAWSLGAGLITVLLITVASSFWDRSTLAMSRSSDSRPLQAPWFQRFYIDALLVGLSAIVWWEVSARSSVITADREGDFTPDFSLLAAPVLVVLANSLAALRLFPILAKVFANIGTRSGSTAVGIGLASVARRPFFHGWPMVALALSICTGIVAGSVVSTLERSSNEQVFYATGADIHLVTRGSTGQVGRAQLQAIRSREVIDVASPALRTRSTIGTTSTGTSFNLLAVDPIDFQQIAWFREDFTNSDATMNQLVDRLAVRIQPEPIEFPEDPKRIAIQAKIEPFTPNLEFWIVIKDGVGDTHTITLGEFEEGWFVAANNILDYPEPIQLTSIQTFMRVGPDSAPPAELLIDDFVVTTGDGVSHLVQDFDTPGLWEGLPTAEGEDTGFTITPEPDGISGLVDGDAGTGIGNISLGRGSNQGIRGIFRRAVDRPIPMIASQVFMDQSGVGFNRPFIIEVQGGYVPVEIIDTVNYFPTLNPTHGPFAVADVNAIADFIELRGQKKLTPNELFASVHQSDLSDAEVVDSIRGVFRLAHINSKAERLSRTFVDPVAVAGWKGMSLIATIVAASIVLLAYAVFLAAFSLRTKGASALMLALGSSTRDHWVGTVSELVPALVIGALVGIGTGVAVSSLMVGTMAHTGSGNQLMPPFILQTNWMLPVCTILAAFSIFIAGVFSSVRSYRVIHVAKMAREGFSADSS